MAHPKSKDEQQEREPAKDYRHSEVSDRTANSCGAEFEFAVEQLRATFVQGKIGLLTCKTITISKAVRLARQGIKAGGCDRRVLLLEKQSVTGAMFEALVSAIARGTKTTGQT